jgi:hypothetical protein
MEVERRLRDVQVPNAVPASSSVRNNLSEIEAALARAANDTYGICVACRKRIEPGRLELLPATPYCLSCATEAAHDPKRAAPLSTGPFDHVRGEQVRFVTDAELGVLLVAMLRREHRTGQADVGTLRSR